MANLTESQLDRAIGSVLGGAVGDALGSAYEFGPSREDGWKPKFGRGYFGHGVGEWTDDTSMAIPILEWVASKGSLPRRHIIERWLEWSRDAKDIGNQTRAVLQPLRASYERLETLATLEAQRLHSSGGRSAGNGALMRIGPLALRYLNGQVTHDEVRSLVQWTHWDEDNVRACSLWVEAIRGAILYGELRLDEAVNNAGLAGDSRWDGFLASAVHPDSRARDFSENNGWVVAALQGALSSIVNTGSFEEALCEAVRGGGDTDTVAAIAGSLAGAIYGAEEIPKDWSEVIYGWPKFDSATLEALTLKAVS